MPLVPHDVRGVSTRAMSEAQRVREEGAAAQTSDAEAKPVQVDLLLQLQQMMAEQARRQEEQARRQEEQARCQAEQLRELKEEQARRQEEQARRQEEQARRQEEQARRQEEQARCQAEQLRELKEDQARRQEEQARRLEEMHKDFTKGLQKAVERVQEVEEGLGKLEHRVMAIEERVEEEISKIKQEVASPSPLKSRSRLAAVFDTPNVASSATKGLKIPHYDGTTSWTAFKLQFETLMEAYGWTQKEAQSALTLALRDQALSVLEAIGASGDLSFSALLDALEARFGDSHLEHVYRAQLKEHTQRANESLQQWSVEIEKLVRRAFRSTPSMIEGTLLQAFIDGVRDPEVRAAVHLGHHKNMKEALAHALEVEAVREPPTPPLDLQVDSVTSNSVKLSWRDTISTHVQYYTLQYTTNDFMMWDTAKSMNITRQENDVRQNIELRDLQPAMDYRVRIASGNQVDLSPYTQPVHFSTQQEAPSSTPLGVQVQQTDNPGELIVSWLPPPRESHNGQLQGYHVKAVPRISGDPVPNDTQTKIVKVMSRKGKQETTLSGLLKNMRYAVSVSAFNSAGNGPFSLPVYQTTREGAPELPPSGVECRGVSSSSLRIAWQPITAQGASLLGYSVYYSTEDGPWQNISSSHTELYLQALLKYTNYTVKVAGFSNYGLGPFSYPIVCTTLQDVPGPPSAIKVLVSSPTSLLVSWKRPEEANGDITHYTVYVKPVSSTGSPQNYRVESTQETSLRHLTFPVSGLSTGRQYEVFVRAHTAVGEGTPSNRVHIDLTSKVVAGVASLGGAVSVGVGSSVLLVCQCVGAPPPRTVWYHKHNIITHHPRFTRNHDDSLLINNIDQSLSGNYTCLAKNLYGSDSVSYEVLVLPTPEPPSLRVTSHKNAIHLQWEMPRKIGGKSQKISYNLTWKEANGSWQDAWSSKGTSLQGTQEYTLQGLKCGTKYSLRMTAANSVGSSQPTYMDATTLGGVPISPTSTEWFWSNATHIYIQLSGWDDNGCEITRFDVEYKEYGSKTWKKAENRLPSIDQAWSHYVPSSILAQPNSFVLAELTPAQWYHVRVTAENAAGVSTSVYSYATTTVQGESVGPPSDFFDLNMLVIICSSILLMICSLTCVYILVKRHNHHHLTEYRNSLTAECKSERSNMTVNTPQSVPTDMSNRVYSTPVHLTAENKHELYEISPYAQFAIGFRTFGHVDNQEVPSRVHLPGNSKSRYDSETSFQMRSESEESDCVSRTTTLKSVPRNGLPGGKQSAPPMDTRNTRGSCKCVAGIISISGFGDSSIGKEWKRREMNESISPPLSKV
ncbi:unnamed protein product [Spodoptera exigua]|nr:unnamed protein product [Spodoptera exigua]